MKLIATLAVLGSISAFGQATDHKKAVENSLSTGYQVTGSPPQRWNITDRMAYHHVPAASVAVIRGGQVEWSGAYGVLETGGKPATESTSFNVASVSKAVTAVAVLHLSQEKKIDLDKDVDVYLRRWKIPANEWTAKTPVTTRMLLNHTAGFGESPGVVYKRTTLPTLLQQLNGQAPATNSPVRLMMKPGSRFEYSNNGYLVLQLLVEEVTGKPYSQAMQELVLSPLGMAHSTFQSALPADLAINAADAFGPKRKVGLPADDYGMSNLAAAGLWTNAVDLAKFAIEIQSAWVGKKSKILNRSTARMMLSPGETFPLEVQGLLTRGHQHWGLGVELADTPHPFFDHGGGAIYSAYLFMYLNGDGMVVTTNAIYGFRVIHELLRSAGTVYGWQELSEQERPRYAISELEVNKLVGDYQGIRIGRFDSGLTCTLEMEEHTIALVPWSATEFITPDMALKFEFHLDPVSHQAVSLDVQSLQDVFNVLKTEPEKLNAGDVKKQTHHNGT